MGLNSTGISATKQGLLDKDRLNYSGNTAGDLSDLDTTDKTSLLAAINEVNNSKSATDHDHEIGNMVLHFENQLV